MRADHPVVLAAVVGEDRPMHTDTVDWLADQAAALAPLELLVEVRPPSADDRLREVLRAHTHQTVDLRPGADPVSMIRRHGPRRRADLVTCVEVLQDAEDPVKVLAACRRMLHRGGVLLVAAGVPVDQMWEWLAPWSTSDIVDYPERDEVCARAIK